MQTTTTPDAGQAVRVTLEKLSICDCGFPILIEAVPLGAEYFIDPSQKTTMGMICGGCNKMHSSVPLVFVYPRTEDGYPGFLPEEIFEES